MFRLRAQAFIVIVGVIVGLEFVSGRLLAQIDTSLPPGVKTVWDLGKAHRDTTTTRERVCLNGLWRWQPAQQDADAVPVEAWGFFKVPGFWPGASSYIQENSQTLHIHPSWKNVDVRSLSAAWYQREFTVPTDWTGRRIALAAEYMNSFAIVYVDAKKAGELRFPAGEVDLSKVCKPGIKYTLSLLVVAMPLKAVLLSYNDTNAARVVKGTVERRGLCGDVWLTSTPAGPRITDVKVDTSVRKGEIRLNAALEGLAADGRYELRIRVRENDGSVVRETKSQTFQATDLKGGRLAVDRIVWLPKKLWDIHTPHNLHHVQVTLAEVGGKALDSHYPVRFGFREFWIDGKDFYLNGWRIFLSAVPLDNALTRGPTRRSNPGERQGVGGGQRRLLPCTPLDPTIAGMNGKRSYVWLNWVGLPFVVAAVILVPVRPHC